MGGKKLIEPFKDIKKPSDLYTIQGEKIKKVDTEAVFDLEAAEAMYNKSNSKPKWLNN